MTNPAERVPPALEDLDAQQLDDAAAMIATLYAAGGPLAEVWSTFSRDLQDAADAMRPARHRAPGRRVVLTPTRGTGR